MTLKMASQNSRLKSDSLIKNVLAVAAGKGGVGKSTITAHLAFALQKMGFSVGVMDADVYGPSMRKLLPEERLPEQKGELLVPALSYGIPLISMAYFHREDEAAAVRAPIANGIVQQFIKNVAWGELDYLLIDFPPGTGDVQLTLSQQAQLKGAIMVTTPQELAVMDVKKAMHLFQQVKIPIVGILENMSFLTHESLTERLYPFGKGGGERLAKSVGVPFLGQIPLDADLCSSSDRGESLFKKENRKSGTAEAFLQAADQIVKYVALIDTEACKTLLVKKMWLADQHQLSIEWTDEAITTFRLSQLQARCPCAGCAEARKKGTLAVDEQVRAESVINVGRYALRIFFNSGCSAGIYEFSWLRSLEQEVLCKKSL